MSAFLTGPIGSYTERDEFQIGTMLVWVNYRPEESRPKQLASAEQRFSVLRACIQEVEDLVTSTTGSSFRAKVAGLDIKHDGYAFYDCTFFDGEYAGEFFGVSREPNGQLLLIRT